MTELHRWIEALVRDKYGTHSVLANAIGMTLSAFGRGSRNGTFSTESLLRLAAEVGQNPSNVLRLAGKGDVAALIERLYGPGRANWRPDIEAAAAELASMPESYVAALRVILASSRNEAADVKLSSRSEVRRKGARARRHRRSDRSTSI